MEDSGRLSLIVRAGLVGPSASRVGQRAECARTDPRDDAREPLRHAPRRVDPREQRFARDRRPDGPSDRSDVRSTGPRDVGREPACGQWDMESGFVTTQRDGCESQYNGVGSRGDARAEVARFDDARVEQYPLTGAAEEAAPYGEAATGRIRRVLCPARSGGRPVRRVRLRSSLWLWRTSALW